MKQFFQPRPKGTGAVQAPGAGMAQGPPDSRDVDAVSRARRTQALFLALALLLSVGLLTLDFGATDTYGFLLIAVLSWIGLYALRQDAYLMRLAQRELHRQARTDGLTGLLNRRAFD